MRKAIGVLIISAWTWHSSISPAEAFTLHSPDVIEGGQIKTAQVFNGFGCSGDNVSPALSWTDAPAGSKSFAVTLYDPDAPTGSGWWHWVVFNIPVASDTLPRNAGDTGAGLLPSGGVQSRTDFGKPGFGGACPPSGHKPHRYIFTVYALKTDKIPLDENAPAAMVGYYLQQYQIAKAVLTATYGR